MTNTSSVIISPSGDEIRVTGSGFLNTSEIVFKTVIPYNEELLQSNPIPSSTLLVYSFVSLTGSGEMKVKVSTPYNDGTLKQSSSWVPIGATSVGGKFILVNFFKIFC